MIIIKQKTANHIMDSDDLANINAGHFVIFEMNSAVSITLTVPQQSDLALPDGGLWGARQTGNGTLTLAGADSMVLTTTSTGLTAPGKNILMTFEKRDDNDVIVQNGAPPKGAWTQFVADIVGWSSTTVNAGFYFISGKTVHFRLVIAGTSNAASASITNMPLPSRSFTAIPIARATETATDRTGLATITTGQSILNMYKSATLVSDWATSGAKNVYLTGTYESQ